MEENDRMCGKIKNIDGGSESRTLDPNAGLVILIPGHVPNTPGAAVTFSVIVEVKTFSPPEDVSEGDANTHAASFYTNA